MSSNETRQPVEVGRDLVREGFAIWEVAHITRGGFCSCRLGTECPSAGKHPVGKAWLQKALAVRARPEWEKFADRTLRHVPRSRNYGLVPPPGSRLMVLDRDDDAILLPLPETLEVFRKSAPPGRRHFYLRLADDVSEEDVPRVFAGGEVRVGGSGHVVGPGSIHASGDTYETNDRPIGIANRDLIDALKALPPVRKTTAGGIAVEGSRHDFLIKAARRLRGYGYETDDITDELAAMDEEYFDGSFEDDYGLDELARMADWAEKNIEPDVKINITFSTRAKPTQPLEFPREAIVGPIGDVVRLFAPTTEGMPTATWAGAVAYLSARVGRDLYMTIGPTRHTCALFPVVVGPTASGKGISLDVAGWLASFADKPDMPLKRSHASSGEGIIWAVRDDKQVWNSKTSTLDLVKGMDDKRLLLEHAEFGGFLRVAQRAGNTLADVVRDAWDGRKLSSLVKGDGGEYSSTGHHVAVLGNVTPGELRNLLSNIDEVSGFGNRFLFLEHRATRDLPVPPGLGADETTVKMKVLKALDKVDSRAGQAAPYVMTDEALDLWTREYQSLKPPQGDDGAARMTERTRTYALRIALLYALLDVDAWDIEVEHLAAGVAVAKFGRDTVMRFLADLTRDERKVVAAIAEAGGQMSRTDVSAGILGRNRTRAQIDATRDRLADLGQIVVAVEGHGRDATEVWRRA
jgi:hypothetical protein